MSAAFSCGTEVPKTAGKACPAVSMSFVLRRYQSKLVFKRPPKKEASKPKSIWFTVSQVNEALTNPGTDTATGRVPLSNAPYFVLIP